MREMFFLRVELFLSAPFALVKINVDTYLHLLGTLQEDNIWNEESA